LPDHEVTKSLAHLVWHLGPLRPGGQLLGPPIRIEISATRFAPSQVFFEIDYLLLGQRELEEIGQEADDVPASQALARSVSSFHGAAVLDTET